MAFHGYVLLEINPAVADSLSRQQRDAIKDAASDLITVIKRGQDADVWPPYLPQVRFSTDKRKVILEGNFDGITKVGFTQKLADRLGVAQAAINAALTVTVFGGGSADWETSRDACLAYLAANDKAWNALP